MKVKYRILPKQFGEYDGEKVFEIEKVCVGTKSMNYQSYLNCRNYSFIVKLLGQPVFSPIYKLTQKIVRNFTYELGIDSKYEVEIDQNEIINRAVDNLISKIELNHDRFKNVINFSYEKTLNDKSWDITNDLHDIAQLIFDENNFSELESLKEYSLKDFEGWKKELKF